MTTKLDQDFVKALRKNHQTAIINQQNARLGFEALVNEVDRLESYCAELELKLQNSCDCQNKKPVTPAQPSKS